jgi:hypothetical protein
VTLRTRNLSLFAACAPTATNPGVARPGGRDANGCHNENGLESQHCRTDAKAIAPNPNIANPTLDECLTSGGRRYGS